MTNRIARARSARETPNTKESSLYPTSTVVGSLPINGILKDIEPSIIIATLTAFLADKFKQVESLFIGTTVIFAFGAIFYYLYRVSDMHEKLVPMMELFYIALNAGGFILFLIGVIFIAPPTIILPIATIAIILLYAIILNVLIKIRSMMLRIVTLLIAAVSVILLLSGVI